MSESSGAFSAEQHAAIPFYRDVRILRWLIQIAILLAVIIGITILYSNLVSNLNKLNLTLSFGFLSRPAGFTISEGPAFDRTSPMRRAFLVGITNTARAAGIGIVAATLVGVVVGVARLSANWLIRTLSLVFVEVMQNTPLLVQLFFWFTLMLSLPAQKRGEIFSVPGQNFGLIPPLAYFSQRGAALPGIERLDSFSAWLPFLIGGLILAAAAWRVRVTMRERAGHPATGQFWWATGTLLAVLVIGWLVVPGSPWRVVIPGIEGDDNVTYTGGWILTNNFQALMLGLVLYTGAFIAEVVRSGIQAVPYGQIEAATAVGLTRGQRLRLVILPQAMRVIIPPLINQYLNLVKNSSLAIAVAYPDLFNISQTIGNQSGQNVQVIAVVMGTYLTFSLVISLVMNYVNKRMQLVER